jgi:predicted DNA-binding transcriptional regulator
MTMFGRAYYIWVVVIVLVTELTIITAVRVLSLETDLKVGIVAFTAAPLFIITLMELGRNLRLQRAAFIKDYISQFFTKSELYQTFHELVYTYTDSVFERVDKIRDEQNLDVKPKPVFDPFDNLQAGRQVGSRLYHPRLFQTSPEERRLDALLGYFDVIAYYYAKGFLRIEDIAGSVGYFLAVMKARKVICEYMKLNHEAWSSPEYNRKMGATPPFSYLERLLDDIQKYNERFEEDIKRLQAKRLR